MDKRLAIAVAGTAIFVVWFLIFFVISVDLRHIITPALAGFAIGHGGVRLYEELTDG